ncbi:SDR family oxidoreductase [Photorhabdus khanii]|uniref:SDR family oxidoreductase n=1 Tax=Photorhabdus khanii TaxID=1004150 RepID=A0A7C9KS79_9GAMM|nr:SDR family oxidoreductase [Photorhabdus khanii]MQL47447.1 SDR family oxidoreductase [Photorhabdus khanii]
MDKYNSKVLIIGSSSEIGNAICKHAVASGYEVLGTSRKPHNEEIHLDVMSDGSVKEAIEIAIEKMRCIDAVIYTPAMSLDGLLHVQDIESWHDVFNVNLFGAARVAKYLLPHFMKNRNGVMQFISSTASVRGSPGATAYSCSKAAMNALVKNIANDYGRFNIRAYSVMPGYVDGGMLRHISSEKKVELAKSIALKRMADVDEIARFCVGALSASTYITGTTLRIDGGLMG